jgi:hypothetical protein
MMRAQAQQQLPDLDGRELFRVDERGVWAHACREPNMDDELVINPTLWRFSLPPKPFHHFTWDMVYSGMDPKRLNQ